MVEPKKLQFGLELNTILNIYTENGYKNGEPLTTDEVDDLISILKPQLNYLNGNLTKEEYEKELDVRSGETKYLLLPVTSINDSSVKSAIVKCSEEFIKVMSEYELKAKMVAPSDLMITDWQLETNMMFLTSDTIGFSDEQKEIYDKIVEQHEHDEDVIVLNGITDEMFETMRSETTVNWNSEPHFIVTTGGFYITDRYDTDVLDTVMVNYSELE